MPLYDVTIRFLNAQTDLVQSDVVTVAAVSDDFAAQIALDHFENSVNFEWYEVEDVVEVGEEEDSV